MPAGPKDRTRPADVVRNAVRGATGPMSTDAPAQAALRNKLKAQKKQAPKAAPAREPSEQKADGNR